NFRPLFWAIASCTGSRRRKNCRSRNWWRRDARKHAGPRIRRDVPPGSVGAPAVSAGVRGCAAGGNTAPRGHGAAVHCGAHAQRHFGELRLSTVFGGCGEAGARIPVRVECAAGRRSARAADGVSVLETCLLEMSDTGQENVEDMAAFKERYRFAFPPEPPPLNLSQPGEDARAEAEAQAQAELQAAARDAETTTGLTGSYFDALPTDDEVPDEILEFFQPEAE